MERLEAMRSLCSKARSLPLPRASEGSAQHRGLKLHWFGNPLKMKPYMSTDTPPPASNCFLILEQQEEKPQTTLFWH